MTDAPTPRGTRLIPLPPLVGAVLAAAIVCAAWALIAHATGWELGYVAWAVGALVGFGSSACGGRGRGMALSCSILLLAAIFAGKVWALRLDMDASVVEGAQGLHTEEDHAKLLKLGAVLPMDTDDATLRAFVVEHDLVDTYYSGEVTDPQLDDFRKRELPELERFRGDPPSVDAWSIEKRDYTVEAVNEMLSGVSATREVRRSIDKMDLVFAALGVLAAWKIGGGGPQPERGGDSGGTAGSARTREDEDE